MSTAPLLFAAAAAVGGGSGGWSCSFHNFCVLWGGAFLKNEFISIYLYFINFIFPHNTTDNRRTFMMETRGVEGKIR